MSKPLTTEQLNKIKLYAKSLGFEGTVKEIYAVFKKEFNESSLLKVYYDVVQGIPYVEIHSGSLALEADEVDSFIEVLGQAREIARKLEGE